MAALYWIWIIVARSRYKIRDACKLIGLLLSLKGKTRYCRKATFNKTVIAQTIPADAEFNPSPNPGRKFQRKPDQVRNKVIYLLAINPKASLREIENIFNRSHALTNGETISHTYVSKIRKKHAYEIKTLAKENHNRRPKLVPRHLNWAADLTFLPDAEGKPKPILGIIEHASRACLCLKAIDNKCSATILRALADIIEITQQKPKFLRTDNESIFTSKAFRFGLRLVHIKHQTTEVASPWQNGKMERFFGIFKQKARGLVFNTLEELNHHLVPFCFWYNHIRPHGYLDGLTPFEAYHKHGMTCVQPGQAEPLFFRAWDNRLTGFWFRRE